MKRGLGAGLLVAAGLGGCGVFTQVELYNNSGAAVWIHDDQGHGDALFLASGQVSPPISWPAGPANYHVRLSAGGCDYGYVPGTQRPRYDYPYVLSGILGVYRFKAQIEPDLSIHLVPSRTHVVAPLTAESRLLVKPVWRTCGGRANDSSGPGTFSANEETPSGPVSGTRA